jgi:hypothetical protein
MEADGTFTIMGDYTLEILHLIFGNESIPVALSIFPSESGQSYSSLFNHVDQVLESFSLKGLLNTIPLVSDQGRSLEALVTERGLKWHLCHRHLIERAGASSQYGDWTARLLRCCSVCEFSCVAATIRGEMRISGLDDDHYEELPPDQIFQMVHQKEKEKKNSVLQNIRLMLHLYRVERWARWLRPFCPTTSNSAESVHASLNHDAFRVQTFLMRLRLVKKLLFTRFLDRDSPLRIFRRSSKNYLRKKARDERMGVKHRDQQAWDEFYSKVNTVKCLSGPQPVEKWTFPRWPQSLDFCASFFSRYSVNWHVPPGFIREPELSVPLPGEPFHGPVSPAPMRRPTEGLLDGYVQSAVDGWDAVDETDENALKQIVEDACDIAASELSTRRNESDAEAKNRSDAIPAGGNPWYRMIGWEIVGTVGRGFPRKHVNPEHIARIFELGIEFRPDKDTEKLTTDQEIKWHTAVTQAFPHLSKKA